jgi:uncharacterized damage-inducible protein DinB
MTKAMATKPDPQISLLLQLIDEAYEQKAWHGVNLRGSIRGLSAKQAAWRPAPKRHNIWEIVVHCAYWKYVVRRRITGDKRGSFSLKGSNWFRRPEQISERAWRQDLEILGMSHDLLREAVADLSPRKLSSLSPKKQWTLSQTIQGIAQHDVYHAGQIQLLKRLMKK